MRGSLVALAMAGCMGPNPRDHACPTPDEDGDCIPDSQDNCPGIANREQTDADADGVGDACDPDPGGADAIRDFYGFNNKLDAADWGGWGLWMLDLAAGVEHHVDYTGAAGYLQSTFSEGEPNLAVETRFTYRELASDGGYIGITVDADPNGTRCLIDPSSGAVRVLDIPPSGPEDGTMTAMRPLRSGDEVTVQLHRVFDGTSGTETCAIWLDGEPQPAVTFTRAGDWKTNGAIVVHSESTIADVHYIVWYAGAVATPP